MLIVLRCLICDAGMKASRAKIGRLSITSLCNDLAQLFTHEKAVFAKSCEKPVGCAVQVSLGFRKAFAVLVTIITAKPKHRVTPHHLRPDLYPNQSDAIPTGFRSIATSDVAKNVCGA